MHHTVTKFLYIIAQERVAFLLFAADFSISKTYTENIKINILLLTKNHRAYIKW